jgi:hypothetical protein
MTQGTDGIERIVLCEDVHLFKCVGYTQKDGTLQDVYVNTNGSHERYSMQDLRNKYNNTAVYVLSEKVVR